MNSLKGLGVAIVTPFLSDKSIDLQALARITNHVILGGVDYIVALGTTAESPTLTEEETLKVVDTIINASEKRVPIVLGCGGNNTQEVIRKMKLFESRFQFEAFMSVTPYYNKPQQKGLYEHYRHISEHTTKNIMLYNVPARTNVNILPDTVLKLAQKCSNITAIKEASGSVDQGMDIIKNKSKNFVVTAGDDKIALACIAAGYDGLVSVLANAYPHQVSRLVHKVSRNKLPQARKIHYKLYNMIDLIFREGNPSGIKALLSILNLCEPDVRLPLVMASEDLIAKINLKHHKNVIDQWNSYR